MNTPKAYLGNDKYIFVSYAHKDKDLIYPIILKLQEKYNVWFDEGIKWGKEWDKEIVDRLTHCSLFIYLITNNSLSSPNCKDEISYAKDSGLPFINICIEDVSLPEEFKFRYGRYQMCFLYRFNNLDGFLNDFIARVGKIVDLDIEEVTSNDTITKKPSRLVDIKLDMFHAAYTEYICKLNNQECPDISKTTLMKKYFSKDKKIEKGYFPFLSINIKNISNDEIKLSPQILATGSFTYSNEKIDSLLLNEYNSRVFETLPMGVDFDGYLAGPLLISFIEAILLDKVTSIVIEINDKEYITSINEYSEVITYIKDNFRRDMIDTLKGEDILYRFSYTLNHSFSWSSIKQLPKEEREEVLVGFYVGSQKTIKPDDLIKLFSYSSQKAKEVCLHLVEIGSLSPIFNPDNSRKVIRPNSPIDAYPTITFGYPPLFIE